jgi:hypothetical protein
MSLGVAVISSGDAEMIADEFTRSLQAHQQISAQLEQFSIWRDSGIEADRRIFVGCSPKEPGALWALAPPAVDPDDVIWGVDPTFEVLGVEAKISGDVATINVESTSEWQVGQQREQLREVMMAHVELLRSSAWCRKPDLVLDFDELDAPRNHEIGGGRGASRHLTQHFKAFVSPGDKRFWTFENEIRQERYAYGVARFIDECLDDFLGI